MLDDGRDAVLVDTSGEGGGGGEFTGTHSILPYTRFASTGVKGELTGTNALLDLSVDRLILKMICFYYSLGN